MAGETTTTQSAESDAGTTQTGAPTNSAVPGAQAAPAAAPARPSAFVNGGQAKKRKGVIQIPESAFKERVKREAAVEVKRRLGVSMEEAEAIVRRGGTQPAGQGQTAVQNTADSAVEQLRRENDNLRKHNERLAKSSEEAQKKAKREVTRANDRRLEAELRAEARMAGCADPDYAVHLFAKAVQRGEASEPATYFAGLKTTNPALFAVAVAPKPAPPQEVAAETAPPESQAAGEVKPKPSPAGSPAGAKNAEDMSPQEFSAHQRGAYGYTPGM